MIKKGWIEHKNFGDQQAILKSFDQVKNSVKQNTKYS